MNLYACYTQSHLSLYSEYFCPSVCFDTSLVAINMTTINNKTRSETIIKIIDSEINDIFIFSDVDIQFFKPITNLIIHSIKDSDIVVQQDGKKYCIGFMAIRSNNKVKNFFKEVLETINTIGYNDTEAFNLTSADNLKIGVFDNELVWSHHKTWVPGDELNVPDNIIIHHANRTNSIEYKIEQMKEVAMIQYLKSPDPT